MFKIELLFQSNEMGVHTMELETATDETYALMKLERMLDRWWKILVPFEYFNNWDTNNIRDLQKTHENLTGCFNWDIFRERLNKILIKYEQLILYLDLLYKMDFFLLKDPKLRRTFQITVIKK